MTTTSSDLHPSFLGLDPTGALSAALRNGGVYADLFVESVARAFVRIEGGEIVRAAEDKERGFAIRRVSAAGTTRSATSTAIDQATLADLAADIGRGRAPGASTIVLASAPKVHPTAARVRPEAVTIERRIELARLAERIARGVSPAIKEASVTVRDAVRTTAVAGSDGRSAIAEHVRAIVAVEVIASEGDVTQSAFEAAGGCGGLELVDEAIVEGTARLAAERAVRMVHARPCPAGEMPVVLAAEAGGTFVHEAVGHSLEADLVIEGLSALGDRVGEVVASSLVTVVDDATIPGKNGTFEIDDEGVPAERTVLIDRGVLVSLLYDERTARFLGARSTGNGRRESFRHRPIVRMSNTMIAPGGDDPAAIIRDTPRGLYVVRMGGGEVDTVTGQFVFEVNEAYSIEDGAIGPAVRGATLAGDSGEALLAIDRVGSDLGFGIGTCGKEGQDVPVSDAEPTIRIPSLVVGGASEAS
jgi:TldD protein